MSRAGYLPSTRVMAFVSMYDTTTLRTQYVEACAKVLVTLEGTGGEVTLNLALDDVQRLRGVLRDAEALFARQASPEITEAGPDATGGAP